MQTDLPPYEKLKSTLKDIEEQVVSLDAQSEKITLVAKTCTFVIIKRNNEYFIKELFIKQCNESNKSSIKLWINSATEFILNEDSLKNRITPIMQEFYLCM